ncbi:hypothetical protein GCM10027403_03290 [Arthrobacter tecti]
MTHQPIVNRSLQVQLSRRRFLTVSGASLLIAGCAPPGPAIETKDGSTTTPPVVGGAIFTVSALIAQDSFAIAHRGSGDNWPEHTMEAYRQAILAGAQAIEVSVCSTRDGVLVCHHDKNTERMTGVSLEIAEQDYSRIKLLWNDATEWIGQNCRPQPIPLLKDVLDAFASKYVIFIEDKQGSNTAALLDLMDSYPDSTEHFVWKQTAAASQYEMAVERGYRTWGYFLEDDHGSFEKYAPRYDLLGIYHGATDEDIQKLVSYDKPVICWEIHTRWMRDKVRRLGVKGLMCSNYPYVMETSPPAMSDSFATGIRAPGDLPWIHAWDYQPRFDVANTSVILDNEASSGYMLGSVSPVELDEYFIELELRWPTELPTRYASAGFVFGLADDYPYRGNVPGPVGGYHLSLRANGQLELFRRDPSPDEEGSAGNAIASALTTAPVAGEWVPLRVGVAPTGVSMERIGDATSLKTSSDTEYRGGYLGLNKNYSGLQAVEFRSVRIHPNR